MTLNGQISPKRDTLKEHYKNLHTLPPLNRIPLADSFGKVFSCPPIPKRSYQVFPSPILLHSPVPFQRRGIIYEGGECQATEMSLRRWRRFQSLQICGSGPDLPVRALFLEWGMRAGKDWERKRESRQNHSCLNVRYSFVKHRHVYNDEINDE